VKGGKPPHQGKRGGGTRSMKKADHRREGRKMGQQKRGGNWLGGPLWKRGRNQKGSGGSLSKASMRAREEGENDPLRVWKTASEK